MTLYGFYSKKAAEKYGSSIYTTPNGDTIEVTLATPIASSLEEVRETYCWDDTIFVGEVCNCVRMNFMQRK